MLFSVPGNPASHLGSHNIIPVPSTSPFCPNYLRKQSEMNPSGKFCRNGLVTSMILCVHVSISLDIKYLPVMQETQDMQVQSLGQEDALEKEMETYSSILAWTEVWGSTDHGVVKNQTQLSC